MTREEQKHILEAMLRPCPDILTPRKAVRWSPLGRNTVYKLIRTGELRSFRYRDGYFIAKADLIEYLLDHAQETDSRKKTRRFLIHTEDLLLFIDDWSNHPEKYATPFAEFSAAEKNASPDPSLLNSPSELPPNCRRTSVCG